MPSTEKSAHQHGVKVIGTGRSVDEALSHALSGLLDPKGHQSHIAFQAFDVLKIAGTVNADGSPTVQVTVEAYGSHK